MDKITADEIAAARELLENNWTTGYAKIGRGQPGHTGEPLEWDYCSVGAISHVRGELHSIHFSAIDWLFMEAGVIRENEDVVGWNDYELIDESREHHHQRVLDGFMKVEKFLRDKGE